MNIDAATDEQQLKISSGRCVKIYYGTQTGTAKLFAEQLRHEILTKIKEDIQPEIVCLSKVEVETLVDLQKSYIGESTSCVFIVATYQDGKPPESASWFCKSLNEHANDFRVSKSHLKNIKFSVFGLGNSVYEENYNKTAVEVKENLEKLGAVQNFPIGFANENTMVSTGGSFADFDDWKNHYIHYLITGKTLKSFDLNTPSRNDEDMVESSSEDEQEEENPSTKSGTKILPQKTASTGSQPQNGLVDLEDLGTVMNNAKKKMKENENGVLKEMVTPELRQALTKQGYKLIGSHSGVKLCRWTKSMLRGRGGCYKHTFYGIQSHQCMEATPSLACANKCVFCWRHHSNPVGTEWKWKMDQAEEILAGALQNHYKMINEFKGVPGVSQERIEEGLHARHCALSLVGEPIMYPQISKFVRLLHDKKISSFLVTNAQFPDAIRDLSPVTQLYVSVDAATKESLKKIDRPLFRDFWERFLDSLRALKDKGQRTVYRLTLVKDYNVAELENYAKLV